VYVIIIALTVESSIHGRTDSIQNKVDNVLTNILYDSGQGCGSECNMRCKCYSYHQLRYSICDNLPGIASGAFATGGGYLTNCLLPVAMTNPLTTTGTVIIGGASLLSGLLGNKCGSCSKTSGINGNCGVCSRNIGINSNMMHIRTLIENDLTKNPDKDYTIEELNNLKKLIYNPSSEGPKLQRMSSSDVKVQFDLHSKELKHVGDRICITDDDIVGLQDHTHKSREELKRLQQELNRLVIMCDDHEKKLTHIKSTIDPSEQTPSDKKRKIESRNNSRSKSKRQSNMINPSNIRRQVRGSDDE